MNSSHLRTARGLRCSAPAVFALAACTAGPANPPVPAVPPESVPVTHGVAAGDVTSHRAVIWARTDRYSCLHLTIEGGGQRRHLHTWVTEARDFAGKVVVPDL